ncbi:hypothetical protein niasHS_016826 [Heterodera schachtii]|uniref:Amino acid transporter n=1 Tax=Heterodera schachtii TaxID=97005 RepID=A0ABD2HTD5_HETSC
MPNLGHYRIVGGSRVLENSNGSPGFLRQNLLLILTVSAVGVGVLLGVGLRQVEPNYRMIKLIGFPGELLMRMLKCVVVPLIVASLVTGLAQLNIRDSGRIGGIAVLYYLVTTTIAVMTGIFLVLTIRPGDLGQGTNGDGHLGNGSNTKPTDTMDTMLDLIRNMLPDNLLGTALRQQQTAYYCVIDGMKTTSRALCEKHTVLLPEAQRDRFIRTELQNIDGSSNILGIIVCSIIVGIVLSQMGDKARTMIDFFSVLDQVSMRIIGWLMWYSPIGIASLIAAKVLEVERLGDTLSRLGLFCATVMAGFAIHFLITLPLIYFLMTRKNPLRFCQGMLQAMAVAFGTASSAATLPTTIRCLEQHLGIDRRVCRFVLPVGATINMDGSAMYEAVATVFIAQMVGRTLNIGQVVVISLTSTLASIGAASIPSGALVAMVMILTAVDLPIEFITLILAVDWFLDRFRTSINVLGDAYGAAIVHHHCREHLSPAAAERPMNGFVVTNNELKPLHKNDGIDQMITFPANGIAIGANNHLLLVENENADKNDGGSSRSSAASEGSADGRRPLVNADYS